MDLEDYRMRRDELCNELDDANARVGALEQLRDELERDDLDAQEWLDAFAYDAAGITGVGASVVAMQDDAAALRARIGMEVDDAISAQRKVAKDAERSLDELEGEWRRNAEEE